MNQIIFLFLINLIVWPVVAVKPVDDVQPLNALAGDEKSARVKIAYQPRDARPFARLINYQPSFLNDVDDDDQDGVPNKWDAHPLGGDPMLNRIFYLPNQSLQLQLPYDYYHYQIINKPRTFTHEFGNLTDFVTPTETLIYYIVGRQLQNEGLTELDHIQYFVTLAQSIDYLGDEETSFLEYPKYPVETLIDGVGDCEDSSFVLASLLLAYQQKTGADFKVVLLRYPKHLAVGLGLKEPLLNTVPALTENGYNYYHLETTNDKWSFGEQPTHLEKEEIIVHKL